MNNVPHFPQFGGQIPLIGQQQPTEQQREQAIRASIFQAVNGLAMDIYARTVSAHIVAIRANGPCSAHSDTVQMLAREAYRVAQAFFEGLGIVQFGGPPPKEEEAEASRA